MGCFSCAAPADESGRQFRGVAYHHKDSGDVTVFFLNLGAYLDGLARGTFGERFLPLSAVRSQRCPGLFAEHPREYVQ